MIVMDTIFMPLTFEKLEGCIAFGHLSVCSSHFSWQQDVSIIMCTRALKLDEVIGAEN